jgi:hypothetical protein
MADKSQNVNVKRDDKPGRKTEQKVWKREYLAQIGEDGSVDAGADSAVIAEALAAGFRPIGDAKSDVEDRDGVKYVVWSVPVEENI